MSLDSVYFETSQDSCLVTEIGPTETNRKGSSFCSLINLEGVFEMLCGQDGMIANQGPSITFPRKYLLITTSPEINLITTKKY